jgi:hypothetical protein
MKVAALTMVYNEPVWARVWARHYAGQVGAENCLVLDHGSDDGSTEGLGVQVERMRRSALDEDARARLISDCTRELLRVYDAVVHSDADELLIADPGQSCDLRAYAAGAAEVETAVGLDLQHLPEEEPALEPERSLGSQREWVRFSAAMCKPALVRRPVRWTPGFHGCDGGRVVGGLYLIHLRYADLGAGLLRLARSRTLRFATADTNPHQRVSDSTFQDMVHAIARLPRVGGDLAELVAPYMARMAGGWAANNMQLGLAGDVLWRLPSSLRTQI